MKVRGVGMADNLVKIRILAKERRVDSLAEVVVEMLEKLGYEVIEWTRPFPGNIPEEVDKSKIFLTALGKDGENGYEN